jgi:hypothetical protein
MQPLLLLLDAAHIGVGAAQVRDLYRLFQMQTRRTVVAIG